MGLFDELDVASASDDPFNVPDGTYECVVEKAEVVTSKEKEYRPGVPKKGLMLTFKITDENENGKTITDYKAIPVPEDPKNLTSDEKRDLSFLKMRMMNLGIPEARINSVEPDDLVGVDCYVTVKKNGDYTNVTKVETRSDVSVTF